MLVSVTAHMTIISVCHVQSWPTPIGNRVNSKQANGFTVDQISLNVALNQLFVYNREKKFRLKCLIMPYAKWILYCNSKHLEHLLILELEDRQWTINETYLNEISCRKGTFEWKNMKIKSIEIISSHNCMCRCKISLPKNRWLQLHPLYQR